MEISAPLYQLSACYLMFSLSEVEWQKLCMCFCCRFTECHHPSLVLFYFNLLFAYPRVSFIFLVSEQSSSPGWLLQSPFHEQVQLIYNVGCVGVVWVFLPLLCVLLCINFFRFHLPTPSPFLGAFEDSHSSLWTWVKYAYTYIYMYICMYVHMYTYMGGCGGR